MTGARTATGKPHFVALDGLRGVAAIAVMVMHQIGIFLPGRIAPLPTYLAVDFFFMLSGFVLAYAYLDPLASGLGWGRFMLARLIRLHPLILLGVTLGGIYELGRVLIAHQVTPGLTVGAFVANLLLLPVNLFPLDLAARDADLQLFGFNGPTWSLFFEYVASAGFGWLALRRWRWRWLRVVGLPLLFVAWVAALFTFGSVTELGRGGPVTFAAGFARVAVPFAMGVSIYNSRRWQRGWKAPTWLAAGALAMLLGAGPGVDGRYDALCILLLFPAILLATASRQDRAGDARFWNYLGTMSYPVYILHVPVSLLSGFVLKAFIHDPVLLVLGCVVATWVASDLALRFYDIPVRRWLRQQTALRPPRGPASLGAPGAL